jgi:hypothetical protein
LQGTGITKELEELAADEESSSLSAELLPDSGCLSKLLDFTLLLDSGSEPGMTLELEPETTEEEDRLPETSGDDGESSPHATNSVINTIKMNSIANSNNFMRINIPI